MSTTTTPLSAEGKYLTNCFSLEKRIKCLASDAAISAATERKKRMLNELIRNWTKLTQQHIANINTLRSVLTDQRLKKFCRQFRLKDGTH